MAYFATELAVPPPVTVDDAVIQEKPGMGYPTGGADQYYPNVPVTPVSQTNPYGAANTPDENPPVIADPPGTPFSYAYTFQTFEEKIAGTNPPGVPVEPVTVAANEPYPVAPPPEPEP